MSDSPTQTRQNHHFTGVHVYRDDCAFVRGVLRDLDEKRVRHAFVMRWIAGAWSRYIVHNNVTAQCSIDEPKRKTLSLCFDGAVHIDTAEGFESEHVDPSGEGPNHLRWMWDIRAIGGVAYAAGMLRMVYRRVAPGRWVRFNEGAEMHPQDEVDAGFRSLDGLVEESIYAVGLHGEIWHCDGKRWSRADSPTNVRLERVRWVNAKLAYACGGAGVILRGEANHWSVVAQEETDETFWDMAVYRNRVYLATTQSLYVLDDRDELSTVEPPPGRIVATNYLDAGNRFLWSVGETDIATFDGDEWMFPTHPLSAKSE